MVRRERANRDADDLADIPVLPRTLLLLNLIVRGRCVDLREMSRLVLDDLGATLQVFRLAGCEYGPWEMRPARIEDCISALGPDACLAAASAKVISVRSRRNAIVDMWDHSKEIAEHSRTVAEEMGEVNPEEAYLVGLLHGIGSLPKILGSSMPVGPARDGSSEGLEMAIRWSLPDCVREYFGGGCETSHRTGWYEIVRRAHRRSDGLPSN
jgi:HD-like signal output (HDOD) protein